MLRRVPVREGIGLVLGHDLTRVAPGEFKGAAFRRGHVIRPEDISELLNMGRDHVYVYEPEPGEIHEDEAAKRLAAALAGDGLEWGEPREGKVSLVAARSGLFRVCREIVDLVNSRGQVVVSTLHDAQPVAAGQVVAAAGVLPLVVPESTVADVENLTATKGPALEVKVFRQLQAGVIVTGTEVWSGRINDAFVPRLQEKLEKYGCKVDRRAYLPDGASVICQAIEEMISHNMELVLVCGGMSVDADDTTPEAIRRSGAEVVVQGTPIFPGAMLMLAYLHQVPVVGLPACVLHDPATAFDLVLPRLLAGEALTREDFVLRGVGGLCRHCPTCVYPACSFGK